MLTTIGTFLLNWVWTKVTACIVAAWSAYQLHKKIVARAVESVQPLKEAKTKEEIVGATDKALDDF